ELASFSRVIDYDARTMREEQVRRQGSYPTRGGGGIPIEGEQRLVNLVNGNYAWAVQGTNVNPQPAAAQTRQLEMLCSKQLTGSGRTTAGASSPSAPILRSSSTRRSRPRRSHPPHDDSPRARGFSRERPQ